MVGYGVGYSEGAGNSDVVLKEGTVLGKTLGRAVGPGVG
jgi:hypothetical protein